MILYPTLNVKGAKDMNKIIITTESVTYAIKARRLLFSVGIPSKLIKIDASLSERGCTHGVMISERDFLSAAKILRDNGLNYSVAKRNKRYDIP